MALAMATCREEQIAQIDRRTTARRPIGWQIAVGRKGRSEARVVRLTSRARVKVPGHWVIGPRARQIVPMKSGRRGTVVTGRRPTDRVVILTIAHRTVVRGLIVHRWTVTPLIVLPPVAGRGRSAAKVVMGSIAVAAAMIARISVARHTIGRPLIVLPMDGRLLIGPRPSGRTTAGRPRRAAQRGQRAT